MLDRKKKTAKETRNPKKNPYKILYQGGTAEIVEKKSRFIASLRPVKTEEEALLFLEETRKRYWDARHNCYAWIIGEHGEQKRCSDDGEPSQTAGRPMLDVLEGEGVCNVCAVVTRYFGGTLLGTGGLVRAYSSAVQEGLKNSTVLSVMPAVKTAVTTDYNGVGKIQYLLGQRNITILDSQYADQVMLTVLIPEEQKERTLAELTDLTNGKAGIEVQDEVAFGILDKHVILLDNR